MPVVACEDLGTPLSLRPRKQFSKVSCLRGRVSRTAIFGLPNEMRTLDLHGPVPADAEPVPVIACETYGTPAAKGNAYRISPLTKFINSRIYGLLKSNLIPAAL